MNIAYEVVVSIAHESSEVYYYPMEQNIAK